MEPLQPEARLAPSEPPASPPPNAPIRLGVPWVTTVAGAEVLLICTVATVIWVHQRRQPGRLCVPDSTAAAGTVCGNSRTACLLLCAYRACNFIWFVTYFFREQIARAKLIGTSFGWLAAVRTGFPVTYSAWCFYVQPWYWLLALASSVLHLLHGDERDAATSMPALGRMHLYLRLCQWGYLEVILPSAWIVTLVVFTLIEPFKLDIMWNQVSHVHFWNTVALTVEFSINRLLLRAGHFVLMMTWITTYVIYAWSMKATTWYRFVYYFMSLETPAALVWYPILIFIHMFVYFTLVAFSRCKERRLDRGGCCCACVSPARESEGDSTRQAHLSEITMSSSAS